jgi:hypothetical protein
VFADPRAWRQALPVDPSLGEYPGAGEKGLDQVLTKAAKVVKRTVEATTDEIASELQEALKS